MDRETTYKEIVRMREMGMGYGAIAKALGRSEPHIIRIRREYGETVQRKDVPDDKRKQYIKELMEHRNTGMSWTDCARLGYIRSQINGWLNGSDDMRVYASSVGYLTYEEEKAVGSPSVASRGIAFAVASLRRGHAVQRIGSRMFFQVVEGALMQYRYDGAGNRKLVGIATMTAGDIMAQDWEIK